MKNKTSFFILVILLLSNILFSQDDVQPGNYENEDNDLALLKLRGQVKSVKKRSWFVSESDTVTIKKGSVYRGTHDREDYTWLFNIRGFKAKEIKMDSDKIRDQLIRVYEYDTLGKIEGEYSDENKKYPIVVYTYNSFAKLVLSVYPESIRSKTRPTRDTFIYNKQNKLTRTIRFDDYDQKSMHKTFTDHVYNIGGRKIMEIVSVKNFTNSIKKIEYGKGDSRIETVTIPFVGKIPNLQVSKFDQFGNMLEYSEKYAQEKEMSVKIFYMYTGNGDIAAVKELNSGKLISALEYKYTYDYNDNWIKCIIYENKKPHCIHEREIKYY